MTKYTYTKSYRFFIIKILILKLQLIGYMDIEKWKKPKKKIFFVFIKNYLNNIYIIFFLLNPIQKNHVNCNIYIIYK